jgi:hypothetical protein
VSNPYIWCWCWSHGAGARRHGVARFVFFMLVLARGVSLVWLLPLFEEVCASRRGRCTFRRDYDYSRSFLHHHRAFTLRCCTCHYNHSHLYFYFDSLPLRRQRLRFVLFCHIVHTCVLLSPVLMLVANLKEFKSTFHASTGTRCAVLEMLGVCGGPCFYWCCWCCATNDYFEGSD